MRRADNVRARVGQHDIRRRALEHLAGDDARASRHLTRRARHGGARIGRDPAGDRAMAEADQRGVAAEDDDAIERHAQLGGADLRQCRLVRLPLR